MFIHEMTEAECRKALEQANFGRLACARDNQPYVVPIYFAYDGKHLYGAIYGFATLGQKIEWMRTNPQVCLEIDNRISCDQWMSVIILGRYEELPDRPEYGDARVKAHELLQRRAMWWEPAYMGSKDRDIPHSLTPIFYRIRIDRMTGHRVTPDQGQAIPAVVDTATDQQKWLGQIQRCLGVKN